jgi:hypothetical protein
MVSVSAVVEKVHQGTGGQQQVWQKAHQVSAVLSEQEVACDQGKAPEYPATDVATAAVVRVMRM